MFSLPLCKYSILYLLYHHQHVFETARVFLNCCRIPMFCGWTKLVYLWMIHNDVCILHVSFRARAKMVNRCHWMNFWQRQHENTQSRLGKTMRYAVGGQSIWKTINIQVTKTWSMQETNEHLAFSCEVNGGCCGCFFAGVMFLSRRNGPTPNFFVFLQLVAKMNEILWRTFQPVAILFRSSSSILRRRFLNVRVEYQKRLFFTLKIAFPKKVWSLQNSKFSMCEFWETYFWLLWSPKSHYPFFLP